jgi:formate dehydrogenase major subunit
MIKLTIDGKSVEVPAGTTVLRAAEKSGISIPTLCDHAHLTPYGSCRLCLVQVEGARTLQTSCTLPVYEGMVVYTDTPEIHDARKFVLTLLFSERNHFCMYCPVTDGDCELQNAAYGEGMTSWPLQPNWEPFPVDGSHDFFVLDHNRCILCRRCVRACAELVGNFTLGTQERGADSRIIADLDVPLGASSCVSCGTCLQVCPTGALIDRQSAYQGREKDVQRIKSTCVGCSVGCGIEMVVRDNRLLRVEGNWDAPINAGVLCQVGRFDPMVDERQRVVTPLIRKNGELKAATWDDALALLTEKLQPNVSGVAALASTRLSAEALYLFKQLFADKLGGDMVTSIEEGKPTALPGWVARKLDKPFEGTLESIAAADCVVAIGADLVENHQVAGFLIKRALPYGTRLVVIDPFENKMHDLAHHSLRPKKGSDYDLLLGIINAVQEAGLAKTEPNPSLEISKHTPEAVSAKTGIPADRIRQVAHLIGASQKPAIVYGKGITSGGFPTELEALLELARVVGALTDSQSAVVGTKGQANSLAAYLYELDKPFDVKGRDAVYLALGDDYPSKHLLERLEKAPFLAVQASYLSAATELADVVLPVGNWAEQDGHFLNLEGRLQAAERGVRPSEEVQSNAGVFYAISQHMGLKMDNDWQAALEARVPTNPLTV